MGKSPINHIYNIFWYDLGENGGLMAFKWDLNGTIVGFNQLLTIIGMWVKQCHFYHPYGL